MVLRSDYTKLKCVVMKYVRGEIVKFEMRLDSL